MPFFGQLDSCLFQADSLSIGRTPHGNENVRSLDRSRTAVTVELQSYLVSGKAFDIEKLAVQKDLVRALISIPRTLQVGKKVQLTV